MDIYSTAHMFFITGAHFGSQRGADGVFMRFLSFLLERIFLISSRGLHVSAELTRTGFWEKAAYKC